MYGQFRPVDHAEADDYITADITVRSESGEVVQESKGVEMLVPGERRKFKGVVAGILVDDLGRQLSGKKLGEAVTIQATGPQRHENEKIAGQPVTLELAITRVQRLAPMPVAELVESMGLGTEEALRDRIREALQHRADAEQRSVMAQQVVGALLEKVDIELPPRLSSRQAASIVQRRAMDLVQRGVPREDIEQHLAELRAASEQQAQHELKQLFVLDAVARELEVEVSEAEVNGRIAQIAAHQGMRPERLREQMRQSGQLDQLFIQLREEKAVATLLKEAKITEVSPEEWRKEQSAGEAEQAPGPPGKKSGSRKRSQSKED
jgi:trigger factor